jgi:hypothetical protein
MRCHLARWGRRRPGPLASSFISMASLPKHGALQRLPDMSLASDEPLPLRPANFVSGLETMPVVFTPSAPVGA